MDYESPISSREELFRHLKPVCVELNQLAFQDDDSLGYNKLLIDITSKLLSILEKKCQLSDGSFDNKLADYVFFPLSQILRRKQKYTDHLTELMIRCIKILVQFGWKGSISLDLAKQLLLLLTFVAGGTPTKDNLQVPEELLLEAYSALTALFVALFQGQQVWSATQNSEMIQAISFSVTVILDGIVDGPTTSIQLQSMEALDGVWSYVKERETLSKFLPGTVSSLTKCLVPTTRIRRSQMVLVRGLEVLCHILTSILSDISTRNMKESCNTVEEATLCDLRDEKSKKSAWLESTSGQIRLALLNIIKLRSHRAVEVRKALNKFCITVLDECHNTLSESSNILTETCMSLHDIDCEDEFYERKTNLKDLAFIHKDLNDMIKCNAQSWLMNLPKIMAGHDETSKLSAIMNISKAQALLADLNIESSILEQSLFKSLRESIMVNLEPVVSTEILQDVFDPNSQVISSLIMQNRSSMAFHPIVMPKENQKEIREKILNLLTNLGTSETQIRLAGEMLEYARYTSGLYLLSSYWLSFQIFKVSSRNIELEEFFDSELTLSSGQVLYRQELFSYSLSLLRRDDDEIDDWRLQAIALEVMAEAAQRMKYDFRSEFVDILYPVVQLLGSSYHILREHAITCLNIFTSCCGYENTKALIIDNVDYLVNDISLRLNTFNIAPKGPQVLVMMIRLTGSSLLPYLDDVVESIFAALANYHGYQQLVGILFSVLSEIVSIGSEPDHNQLIKGEIPSSHQKKKPPLITIESIIAAYLSHKTNTEMEDLPHEKFPEIPWESVPSSEDKMCSDMQSNHDSTETPAGPNPSQTKTYQMVQSIARLSQHYLTSSSSILRLKLLELIRKSAYTLSYDEDKFLPLINELWPVVIKRIYDNESFVCIAACDTVAELCSCTGDFLSTRISSEWADLIKLARVSKQNLDNEKKGVGARGIYTKTSQVWESIVRLMIAILENVRVDDEIFDDLLELFGHMAWEKAEIRAAMEVINSDALWLAEYISGGIRISANPTFANYKFVPYDTIHSSC